MGKRRPLFLLLAAGIGAAAPAAAQGAPAVGPKASPGAQQALPAAQRTPPGAQRAPVLPYEAAAWPIPRNAVDAAVEPALASLGLSLRPPASDEVFVRRAFLDLLGTPPTRTEAEAFLADPRPDKRAALVDSLFSRAEYAEYQSLKWGDILRIKSEFPSNLWPNAVQAYGRWIRDAIRSNVPYDRFARELLVSSGSNFRVPQANFYRAVDSRDGRGIARAVALALMGARLDALPEPGRSGMADFFSRVAYKKTFEWKEEIVYLDPKPAAELRTAFPDGSPVVISADADPRAVFADWLLKPGNPYFARAVANRIWYWTMGTGIVDPVDDLRPSSAPACPELLEVLEAELARSGYDLRSLYRLVMGSRTYQQSTIPAAAGGSVGDAPAAARFARYTVRRLDAESLIDALCRIGGSGESYSSPIPEPFTFIPSSQRTIALVDGSITSAFLVKFGRPPRDTGLASERDGRPTTDQALYLLNSNDVRRRIESGPLLKEALALPKGKTDDQIALAYLSLLSRRPTDAELKAVKDYMKSSGLGASRQAAVDLVWAIVNGKEFLYKH
jgi:hypothetical protein